MEALPSYPSLYRTFTVTSTHFYYAYNHFQYIYCNFQYVFCIFLVNLLSNFQYIFSSPSTASSSFIYFELSIQNPLFTTITNKNIVVKQTKIRESLYFLKKYTSNSLNLLPSPSHGALISTEYRFQTLFSAVTLSCMNY